MSNIRLTQNQLQTPDGSELAQICRAIIRRGKLDLNGIKALRKWLRAHRTATEIPAINYLTQLMERITADGFINQTELNELRQALISVLPEPSRTDPPPPLPTKPEPWWTFAWMPTWGWWAFGGWALIAFFMLVLAVVQSKKADRPDAAPEVAILEPSGVPETQKGQETEEANVALKERLEKLERQLTEQKKQAKETSQKRNPQDNITESFEQIKEAVVRIDCNDPSGTESHGSGFVVAKDVIVTNHHVVGYSSKAEITFHDGTKVQADGKLHLDESKDIAILRVTNIPRSISPLPLLDRHPEQLQRVVAIGHPLGANYSTTQGVVSGVLSGEELNELRYFGQGHEGTWVQHDAAIYGGNSGGPLINEQGRVIGMNTVGSKVADNNFTFSISSVDLQDALKNAESAPLVPFKPHDPNDVLSRFIGEWKVITSDETYHGEDFDLWEIDVEYAAKGRARGGVIEINLVPEIWRFARNKEQPAYGTANDLTVTADDSSELKELKQRLAKRFRAYQINIGSEQLEDFFVITVGRYNFLWDPDVLLLTDPEDPEPANGQPPKKFYKFFTADHWLYRANISDDRKFFFEAKRQGIPAESHVPNLVVRDESAGGRPALENIEDGLKTDVFWETLRSQSDIVTRDGKPFTGWARSDFSIFSRRSQKHLLGEFEDGLLTRLIRWHENGGPEFDLSFSGASIGHPNQCYFWTIDLQSSKVPFLESLNGRCTEWHNNGKKREQSWFTNGKPNRMHHGWHENGEKKYDFSWELGQPHGKFRNYDSNGQLRSEGQYKDGALMTVNAWLENGDSCSLTKVTNGNGRWIERYRDGSIESSVEYRDGQMHGISAYYYQGGQQEFRLNYEKGILAGDASSWHENGQKFYQGSYREGKEDGDWTYWHPNGQKSGEVKFADGKPVSDWKYWDESGKRVSSPDQKLAAQQEETEKIRTGARETIPSEKLKVTVAKEKILFSTKIWYGFAEEISLDLLQQAMEQARQWKNLSIWDEYGVVFSQSPTPRIRLRVQAYELHSDPLHPWTGELLVKGRKFGRDSGIGSFRKNGWSTIKDPPDRWSGYEENYGRFLVRAWFRDKKLYEYQIIEK